MKKFLMIVAMGSVLCTATTSCDEEDEPKNEEPVTATEASNFGGEHLISVGFDDYYTYFSYNADGSLRQIEYGEDKITFDYTTGTATFSDGTLVQKARFTTNKKGYITEFSSSGADEDGKWTVSWQFQYNGSDHLTNVATNQVYKYADTKETEVTDLACKLMWDGDLLLSSEGVGKMQGPDGEERWSRSIKFIYTDATDNRYMQYTDNVIGTIDIDGDIEDIMFVGLLGKGPSKYPSKMETKDSDEQESYEQTDLIDYELNSKGLVERENVESHYENVDYSGNYNHTVVYSYDSFSKASAPATDKKAGVGRDQHKSSHNHISLFGKKK